MVAAPPGTPAAPTGDGALVRLVQTYLDHLVVERGVSRHTLAAYRRDLRRYLAFLAEQGVREPAAVTPCVTCDSPHGWEPSPVGQYTDRSATIGRSEVSRADIVAACSRGSSSASMFTVRRPFAGTTFGTSIVSPVSSR